MQAAVLLANLESLLTEPTQAALDASSTSAEQRRQVNHANSYHALKHQLLDLLYQDIPAPVVLQKLQTFFRGSPVPPRPDRSAPKRRRKQSFNRSYHFQRRVKKIVF